MCREISVPCAVLFKLFYYNVKKFEYLFVSTTLNILSIHGTIECCTWACMCVCIEKSNLPECWQMASLPCCKMLCLCLCLSLCDESVRLLRPRVEFARVSRPPRASSLSLTSVSRVAVLLAANSALIQKLFYAVKRACDKQGGESRRQFLVALRHIQSNSSWFCWLICSEILKGKKKISETKSIISTRHFHGSDRFPQKCKRFAFCSKAAAATKCPIVKRLRRECSDMNNTGKSTKTLDLHENAFRKCFESWAVSGDTCGQINCFSPTARTSQKMYELLEL